VPQPTIADLAFRFAPAFSLAEQASVRVSPLPRVFARALRCFVFLAVALTAFVLVDWRVFLPGESLDLTPVWPLTAVSPQAGELLADALLAAVWLPAAAAFQAADSCFVPDWPPGDSVGALLARADWGQCPAAFRLYVHPPVDFPLDDSAPRDSLPDDPRCPALALLRAQE
jgi:hypothetical protein